jgi:hypothetical protein
LAFDEKASMPQRSLSRVSGILALAVTASFLPPLAATADDAAATGAFIDEVRHSFTLNGKPIPPEIFRDFGDGDLADSGSIWVTVDVKAAIGSNLYFDDIKQNGSWINQKKATSNEETGYTHFGTTENRLLVVLSAFSGGGSGNFIFLHILDVAAAPAFDFDGKIYERINLTNLRSIPLGDRWDGEISIEKNTITIVTTRKGPADDSGVRETTTIEAIRP